MASVYSIRAKLVRDEVLEPADRLLVDPFGEERHVVGSLVRTARKLERSRSSARSALSEMSANAISGSDHPELGQMPAGVRVLRPEGRSERVHARQRQAVRFDVELAGDGQIGRLAEEVPACKSTPPSGVRGRLARSSVETRNSSPAPSASLAVRIGVWIQ